MAKDEIVAVVVALPEPFGVLVLMHDGIELRDRKYPVAADEAALVAEAFEIGKYIADIA